MVAALNGTKHSAADGNLLCAVIIVFKFVMQKLVGLPEVTWSLLPGGGGIVRMVRLLGFTNCPAALLMEGKQLSVEKAQSLGLIHDLAENETEFTQ